MCLVKVPDATWCGLGYIYNKRRTKEVTAGTVKWFNPTKGYGFIEPEDGSKDAFVHISAVERAGLTTLNEGQKVEFELVPGQNGKSSAENLVVSE
jgi:CspA family cold shock protein